MNKKILLMCYEVPGFGGANTASYTLFEDMQQDGMDVAYLNLIHARDVAYFTYRYGVNYGNPRCLPDVDNCVLRGSLFRPHHELARVLEERQWDIVIGVGHIAALLAKLARPETHTLFITTGCNQLEGAIQKRRVASAIAYTDVLLHSDGSGLLRHDKEHLAVKRADLVICHSDLVKYVYENLFSSHKGKIYPEVIWRADWIHKRLQNFSYLSKPFSERQIDVLFVANSWKRPVKNYQLVKNVVAQLHGLNIHIVGETDTRLPHVTYHGFITQREALFALIGNAKSVVSPSLFDASPGLLFEAATLGCNVVASKNCGNWQLCHHQLLVDPFDVTTLLEKIALSLTKKFDDNMPFFLKQNSYRHLIDLLSVF